MDSQKKNFKYDIDPDAIKLVALFCILILGVTILIRNPQSEVVELIIVSLLSFVVGWAATPKKNI